MIKTMALRAVQKIMAKMLVMSLVATTTTAVLVTTVAATARVIWHQQKS
jgi:hypothetical protein